MEAKEEDTEEVEAAVADVMEDLAAMVVGVRVKMTRNSRKTLSMVSIPVISHKDLAQLTGNLLVVMVGHM